MRLNHTLHRLRQGATVFGSSMQFYRSAEIPRLFAAAGLDFVFVDTEHGGFSVETVQDMVAASVAAGITPLVRVCELLYSQVARMLDVGAQGIILPRVEDPERLRQAVAWMKYPPRGQRGYGVMAPLLDYEAVPMEDVITHLNENTMVVVQFETCLAVERADDLLAVPGIDAVMVGPADLSLSLGIAGQFDHPRFIETVDRLFAKCRQYGVAPGIHCRTAAQARFWTGRGARFAGAGSDHSLLLEKVRETAAVLRGAA